jgi:hypothetical protein
MAYPARTPPTAPSGYSFGPNGTLVPTPTGPPPGNNVFSRAVGAVLPAVQNWATPAQGDTSMLGTATRKAFGVEDALANQRKNYQGQYNPWAMGTLQNQGRGAIGLLQGAAEGNAPSAAELQLRDQASRNASQAFGMASGLQGSSPGMALESAQRAATGIQGQTNVDAAALRANEMANARTGLVGAIQGQQGMLGELRGQDINQQNALLGGQIGSLNAGTTAAGAQANANVNNAAGKNAFKGSLLGAGGTLAGKL